MNQREWLVCLFVILIGAYLVMFYRYSHQPKITPATAHGLTVYSGGGNTTGDVRVECSKDEYVVYRDGNLQCVAIPEKQEKP